MDKDNYNKLKNWKFKCLYLSTDPRQDGWTTAFYKKEYKAADKLLKSWGEQLEIEFTHGCNPPELDGAGFDSDGINHYNEKLNQVPLKNKKHKK